MDSFQFFCKTVQKRVLLLEGLGTTRLLEGLSDKEWTEGYPKAKPGDKEWTEGYPKAKPGDKERTEGRLDYVSLGKINA